MAESGQKIRPGSVLCVFLASVAFSTGGLFIKMVPWSALPINGARNLIGSMVIGIYLLIRRHRIMLSRQVIIGAFSLIRLLAKRVQTDAWLLTGGYICCAVGFLKSYSRPTVSSTKHSTSEHSERSSLVLACQRMGRRGQSMMRPMGQHTISMRIVISL